jgi:hypothetical protein
MMVVEPVIASSARRHKITDDDMLHAHRNFVDAFDLDDGLTMLVGPDTAGRLLEVGVISQDDRDVIVHAMPLRPRFTR